MLKIKGGGRCMYRLLKSGRVIDPANSRDGIFDILIGDEKVLEIAPEIKEYPEDTDIIDCSGKWVLPGFVDLHVHLREPGYEYKEDIESGMKAAVSGGFTTICCKANTLPVNDNPVVTEYIISRAKSVGICDVYPIGAVSKNLEGKELAEIGEMIRAGVVAISDDGNCVYNSELMKNALLYSSQFGIPVSDHCEDNFLKGSGVVNEGRASIITGLKGIPSVAEEVMVYRDLVLANYTGGRIHFDHISTKGSVEILRWAREKGIYYTAEVTPHHLLLTEDAVCTFDPDTKVNPPLRSEEDREALLEALRDGVIQIIATDHAPHDILSKSEDYVNASFGISGLETAFSLVLKLVWEGKVPLEVVVRALTINPAKAYNLDAGHISPYSFANVIIVDPDLEWVVDPSKFYSKGKNTPFKGWKLKGKVVKTIYRGRIVYEFGGDT